MLTMAEFFFAALIFVFLVMGLGLSFTCEATIESHRWCLVVIIQLEMLRAIEACC